MKTKILSVVFVCVVMCFGLNVLKSQMRCFFWNEMDAKAQVNPEIKDFDGFYLHEYKRCKICEPMENSTCNIHSQVPC